MNQIVYWEAFVVSGNPRVNPNLADKNRVLCAGYTPVKADSEGEARKIWEACFPEDHIVQITDSQPLPSPRN